MISAKDPNQIIRAEHDEEFNSKRVTIVGGDFGIAEAVKEGLKDFKIEYSPLPIPSAEQTYGIFKPSEWPLHVEKQVIVKDYEVLNIPKLVYEYKILEVPSIVYETKIVEIEKQVIVKEIQIIEVPKIVTEYQTIEKPVIIEKLNNKVLVLFFIGQLLILALSKLITIP